MAVWAALVPSMPCERDAIQLAMHNVTTMIAPGCAAANVLKGNERDKYVVATKFGYYLKPDNTIGVRGDAEHIRCDD